MRSAQSSGRKVKHSKQNLLQALLYIVFTAMNFEDSMRTQSRFNAISQIASGKLNYANSGEAIRQMSISDPKLGEAMEAAVNSDGKYKPSSKEDKSYQKVVNNVFSASSQEEISEFLVEALQENANGAISRDRLAVIVNAAMQRSDSLP